MSLINLRGGSDEGWRDQAACRGSAKRDGHFQSFFPQVSYDQMGRRHFTEKRAAGKALCDACPVREECLDYAMARSIQDGLWGGMGHGARSRLRRARNVNREVFLAELGPVVDAVACVV